MKSPQPLDSSSPRSPASTFPPNLFYDPNSVLDPNLTTSPAVTGGGGGGLPTLPWDLDPIPSDDWDPLTDFLLSERDDLTPSLKSHDDTNFFIPNDQFPFLPCADQIDCSPPPPQQPLSFERIHLELLIRASEHMQSGDLQAAHGILARLNHQFPSPAGGALQRAAFHFRDALLSLLPLPHPPAAEPPFSPVELVHRIAAHKNLSDLSPIPQFAGFTANQTLLETLDGARAIHLIDFDLGLGGQWSSFAQEIAARSRAARRPPPPIRITAVVPEDSAESSLAADNLRDFGRGIGVHLAVDFVRVGGLGALALGGVRLGGGGEAAAVVLTPYVFRLLGGSPESDAALLRFVRRASPRIVVFVDTEPYGPAAGSPPPSFRRSFASSLEFYAAVLESLDAAAAATGAGIEPVSRIERSVLRPRIFTSVGSCWTRSVPWREIFLAAGMSPVSFSEFTESQAEWLLKRAPVEGFHVARCEGSMMLTWRMKELAATSAWRC